MLARIKELLVSSCFEKLRAEALRVNEFFSEYFIDRAIQAIVAEFLDDEKYKKFCQEYNIKKVGNRVGVLCAGNLPLVGFGDMFYALTMGCEVVLKCSRRDPLMRVFAALEQVTVVDSIDGLEGCDAILAMGSDATCEMLRERFSDTELLLRGTMHSVGVLTGGESDAELLGLLDDMLLYCGMGCRSVSRLYVPQGYDFSAMVQLYKDNRPLMPRVWWDKYRYERAMCVMRGEEFVDCGSFILKSGEVHSVCTIEYFKGEGVALDRVQFVSQGGSFGRAQQPRLEDFSSGVSVIDFLRFSL
ncbi:MAG: hypothetical protein R3Y49_06040 [Rikenellaceae bacterium]